MTLTAIQKEKLIQVGLSVIDIESQAVARLCRSIDDHFAQACQYLLACQGRVVVIGMGKSGHIGGKIAATLASTGTPAFFVHPAEACHGDLGMITDQDVVLALSNSGNTSEILQLLPLIKRLAIPLISLTGDVQSTLARAATVNMDVGVEKEACPLGLAPTASTTAALVMGDALAVALLKIRGFSADDFAFSHPAGRLGKRLWLQVGDLMHHGERVPKVLDNTPLDETLLEMSRKGLGLSAVVDADNRLLGIFTDGDLRRTLDFGYNVHQTTINQVMSQKPKTVKANELAINALDLMQRHKISGLLVVDDRHHLIGALHMHDLLRAGL